MLLVTLILRPVFGNGYEPLLHLDDQRRLGGGETVIMEAFLQVDVKAVPVILSRCAGPSAAGPVDLVGLLEAFYFVGGDHDVSGGEPDAALGVRDRQPNRGTGTTGLFYINFLCRAAELAEQRADLAPRHAEQTSGGLVAKSHLSERRDQIDFIRNRPVRDLCRTARPAPSYFKNRKQTPRRKRHPYLFSTPNLTEISRRTKPDSSLAVG